MITSINKLIITALLLLFLSLPALAENFRPGIYSSLEYHEESGDLLGAEIYVIPAGTGYWVVFQESQGEPAAPILVSAEIAEDAITFDLPDKGSGYAGRFTGKFLEDGRLEGRFEESGIAPDGSELFELRYGPGYWQR